jgi:hypothetical protein
VNSGGTIRVNGITVKIPANTMIAFPAVFIPFAEVATAYNAGGFGADAGFGHEVSVGSPYVVTKF